MTPPAPTAASNSTAAPAPVPVAKPVDPVKPEVKADVATAPASVAQPADKPADPPKTEVTVRLDLGYDGRDFNGLGVDHHGLDYGIAGGLLRRDGRVSYAARLSLGYADLSKNLNPGVSSADVLRFGVEGDVGYSFVHGLSAHFVLGLGLNRYSAEDSTDGTMGAEVNQFPLLIPLHDTLFHVSAGARLCFYNTVCLGADYVKDIGNTQLELVDGGKSSPVGLSFSGWKAGVEVEVLSIGRKLFDNDKKGPAVRSSAPVAQGQLVEAPKVAPNTVVGEEKAAAAPAPATGLALFEAKRDENKKYAETAKKAAGDAKSDKDGVDKVKTGDGLGDARSFAVDAVSSFRNALAAVNSAEAVVADLEKQVGGFPRDDKTKAQAALAFLKDAKASAQEAKKQAGLAWDSAHGAVEAFNKKRDKLDPVDFPDANPNPKPGAAVGAPSRRAITTPPPVPAKKGGVKLNDPNVEIEGPPKPDPKAAAKPDPKAAAKPDPKAAAKPDPKAAAKPDPKAAAKSDPKVTKKHESVITEDIDDE